MAKGCGTVGKGVFFHAADLNLGVLAGTSAAVLTVRMQAAECSVARDATALPNQPWIAYL